LVVVTQLYCDLLGPPPLSRDLVVYREGGLALLCCYEVLFVILGTKEACKKDQGILHWSSPVVVGRDLKAFESHYVFFKGLNRLKSRLSSSNQGRIRFCALILDFVKK